MKPTLKRIEMVIDGEPAKTTAQQKGIRVVGKFAMHYKKARVVAEESRLARAMLPHRIPEPIEGAAKVTIGFYFPFTKAEAKKHRDQGVTFCVPKTVKPDVDNCAKTVLDMLTKSGFFFDDAQVTDLVLFKRAGFYPRIVVTIEEL